MEGLVYKLAEQSKTDPQEFVLSDETVDRYGDVISVGGWDLANFQPRKNPIALFNHHSDEVIGRWESVRVEGKKLLGRLILADEGTSDTVNKIRKLWQQGILRAVSVGFRSLQKEKLTKDADEFWGPFRYLRQELVECSLVAVPANPNALQVSRAFGDRLPKLPDEVQRSFSARPHGSSAPAGSVTRAPASSLPTRTIPMKLADRIKAGQAEVTRLLDMLTALSNKDEPTDDEVGQIETLTTEIDVARKALDRDLRTEKTLGLQTHEHVDRQAPGVEDIPDDQRRPFAVPKKKIEPRDYMYKLAVVNFLKHVQHKSVDDILIERYGGDETTQIVLRAAVNPAMTSVPTWAQELVGIAVADFINSLMPVAIYPRVSSRGARFTFDRNGVIRVPARSPTPTISGAFIGEGQPIPVRRLGLTSINLTPKKMGVISTFTRELAMHSTPSIEAVIRDAMAEDTAVTIDSILIDDQPATVVRPAGLRFGVAGLTPSVAPGSPQKMVDDLRALITAITAVNGGRDIVILINPAQATSISFMQTTSGDFMFASTDEAGNRLGVTFISSTTVPAGMLIAVDAVDFASATGDTPEYDVSDQATIHEEDTAPLPIIGGVTATPVPAVPTRSLWQTASLGVRMLLDINWAMRRSGMVSWMTGVTW